MSDDSVLWQLRRAFARINKQAEAAERSAERVRRKAERKKGSRIRSIAAAKAKEDAEKFGASILARPCSECGKPAKADPEFFLNPVQCERCSSLSQSIHLGIHARESIDFSEVTILKGGAPGLGKRK